MTTTTISSTDDVIDMRDVTDRVEELEEARASLRAEFDEMPENEGVDFDNWVRHQVGFSDEEADELATLTALLADLEGNGGDHDWRGAWYPVSLIRDSYFTEAMRELCEDIGDVPKGFPSYLVIDWEATADNLRVDYSSVEFEGVTYWYR